MYINRVIHIQYRTEMSIHVTYKVMNPAFYKCQKLGEIVLNSYIGYSIEN